MNRTRQTATRLVSALCLTGALFASDAIAITDVEITTSEGTIKLELDETKAPATVENFVRYAKAGHYDGTVFHRVIKDFMIQGGGFDAQMVKKTTDEPITNEAYNGLSNLRGSIAMARTSDPHSATAQFFINLKDNEFLDFKARNVNGWGYAVFGRVVEGMEVVDRIGQVATDSQRSGLPPRLYHDKPVTDVVIEKVSVQ